MQKLIYFSFFLLSLILLIRCTNIEVVKDEKRTDKLKTCKDKIKPIKKNSTKEAKPIAKKNKVVGTKYFYPNMSACGGAVYGIYKNEQLIRIESTFASEFGYSSKNVDFKNDKIHKITYHEHFAEYEKYKNKYPNDEEFDPLKMTFSDTVFVFEITKKISFKKYARSKQINAKLDQNLFQELLNCAESMRNELLTEKQLVDN